MGAAGVEDSAPSRRGLEGNLGATPCSIVHHNSGPLSPLEVKFRTCRCLPNVPKSLMRQALRGVNLDSIPGDGSVIAIAIGAELIGFLLGLFFGVAVTFLQTADQLVFLSFDHS